MFLFLRNIACIRINSDGIRIEKKEIDAVLCIQKIIFIIRCYYISFQIQLFIYLTFASEKHLGEFDNIFILSLIKKISI